MTKARLEGMKHAQESGNFVLPKVAKALGLVNAIRVATILRLSDDSGWSLVFEAGTDRLILRMRDTAEARRFRTIDAAASFAVAINIPSVTVDLSGWVPAKRLKGGG